ncbi:hypothetical protein PMAYCL1PPCAC_14715, partial [Pristionchus mayeri]
TLEILRHIFLQCSEIRFLEFVNFNVHDLEAISKTLRNLPVNELCVKLRLCDEQKRSCILDVVRNINTKSLTIKKQNFSLEAICVNSFWRYLRCC